MSLSFIPQSPLFLLMFPSLYSTLIQGNLSNNYIDLCPDLQTPPLCLLHESKHCSSVYLDVKFKNTHISMLILVSNV